MKENDWLVCTDPKAMLEFLGPKASERKLRLFGCACCRRIWHLIPDEPRRKAVEHAEAYADGLINSDTLHQALLNAIGEYRGGGVSHVDGVLLQTCYNHPWQETAIPHTISLVDDAASAAIKGPPWDDAWMQARLPEFAHQASLLRDIFGSIFYTKNLFRTTLLDPDRMPASVRSLATQIYTSNHFSLIPILADALEDSGFDDADVLDHCRNPGDHVRGCWVLDLILGKD